MKQRRPRRPRWSRPCRKYARCLTNWRVRCRVADFVHPAIRRSPPRFKSRLWGDEGAPGTKIKVKTESGIVYLMGLLTRAEASAAAEVARTTAGVTKVVTLFEYID